MYLLQLNKIPPTLSCDSTYVNPLFIRHEAQVRKYHEAREKASKWIDYSCDDAVSEIKTWRYFEEQIHSTDTEPHTYSNCYGMYYSLHTIGEHQNRLQLNKIFELLHPPIPEIRISYIRINFFLSVSWLKTNGSKKVNNGRGLLTRKLF